MQSLRGDGLQSPEPLPRAHPSLPTAARRPKANLISIIIIIAIIITIF